MCHRHTPSYKSNLSSKIHHESLPSYFLTLTKKNSISRSRPFGTAENAIRIQIYVAIIAYCIVAIVEHEAKLNRTTFNVLRVIIRVLTDKTPLRDLVAGPEPLEDACENVVQLEFVFSC